MTEGHSIYKLTVFKLRALSPERQVKDEIKKIPLKPYAFTLYSNMSNSNNGKEQNDNTEGFSKEVEFALLFIDADGKSFEWRSITDAFPMNVLDYLKKIMKGEQIEHLEDIVRRVKKDPSYKDCIPFGKQRVLVSRVKETPNASIVITVTKD